MKFPSWAVKIAAAAVIPIIVGVGTALSAPSAMIDDTVVIDDSYQPGEYGVDYAAVTGPVGSALEGKSAKCEDATWPTIPAGCLDSAGDETPRPLLVSD